MYKILVLGVVLSLQLSDILGLAIYPPPSYWHRPMGGHLVPHTPFYPGHRNPMFDRRPPPLPVRINPSDVKKPADDVNDSIASSTQQAPTDASSNNMPTDLITAPTRKSQTELSNSVNIVGKQLSSEYLVTKGIGAHKLHLRKLPWNKARKVCIDEGGQLADIRSDSEENIVLRMLFEDSVESAWIGYHDMFEEGEWVSVLGEPFGKSGWDRWWKKRLPNPDNGDGDGEEDCACLMKDGGGINDFSCSKELPFVCKITAL